MFDYLIVGAGWPAVCLQKRLARQSHKKFSIIDNVIALAALNAFRNHVDILNITGYKKYTEEDYKAITTLILQHYGKIFAGA